MASYLQPSTCFSNTFKKFKNNKMAKQTTAEKSKNSKTVNSNKKSNNSMPGDKVNIGISNNNSKKVADELNQVLSDEFVLYTKTLKFHWNIEGRDFHALHVFLEEQYQQLQITVDAVAERIRKVGHFAFGSMKEFLANTSLKEHTSDERVTEGMLSELVSDHEALIRKCRELIGDFEDKYDDKGSADFITGIMKDHEKMAWMLRASVPQSS